MKIANPLYDYAFKYLMSNDKLAKKTLEKLMAEQEVEALFAKQESELAFFKAQAEAAQRKEEEAKAREEEAKVREEKERRQKETILLQSIQALQQAGLNDAQIAATFQMSVQELEALLNKK